MFVFAFIKSPSQRLWRYVNEKTKNRNKNDNNKRHSEMLTINTPQERQSLIKRKNKKKTGEKTEDGEEDPADFGNEVFGHYFIS